MQQIHNGSFLPADIASAVARSLTLFGWTSVDGVDVPYIQRDTQRFFPVRIAERKFLSQFANVGQFNVQNPMLSQYMYDAEALALTNSGCGEVFTAQDLLVNLDEFTRFYEEVKLKCTRDCSRRTRVVGGWVQINNTVLPYIIKDDSVMISLAIVRCAAGLLVGRDVPVVYPDELECKFLNDSCKSFGISFDFTTETELVEMVLMSCMCDERPFVRQLPCGNPFAMAEIVTAESRTDVNAIAGVNNGVQPIDVFPTNTSRNQVNAIAGVNNGVQHIDVFPTNTSRSEVSAIAGVNNGVQPIDGFTTNTIPVMPSQHSYTACDQQQWLPNGYHSTGIQITNTCSLLPSTVTEYNEVVSPVVHVSSESATAPLQTHSIVNQHLQSVSVGDKQPQCCPNVVIPSPYDIYIRNRKSPKEQRVDSGVLDKYVHQYNNALTFTDQLRKQLVDVCQKNVQSTADAAASMEKSPPVVDRTSPKTLRKDTPKQIPSTVDNTITIIDDSPSDEVQTVQRDAQVSDADDVRAGDSLLLRRIECFGKTITCMVKHDKLYILLEAMNRLYFPNRRLDTVIKAVTESLHVPVATLTAEEERDFMKFYKLPADKLNSNKVISVDDFVGVYRDLQYMLDNSYLTSRFVEVRKVVEPPAVAVSEGLTNSAVRIPVMNSAVPIPVVSSTVSIPVTNSAVPIPLTNSAGPIPVGIPVLNVSNTVPYRPLFASHSPNNHSAISNGRLPDMAQGQLPHLVQRHLQNLAQNHSPNVSQSHLPNMAQSHLPNMAQSHLPNISQSHLSNMAQNHMPNVAQSSYPYPKPTLDKPLDKPSNAVFGALRRNASEDISNDQKPPKRSRTRVIGDVICIDD